MNRVFFLCFMFFALLLLPSCSQSPDHSVSEEASSTLPQSEQGQEDLTPSQSQENTPSSQGQQESSQKTESLGSSSNQGEWDSPSGRYPYTSQAVLDYYAAHPQWEEYYWEYLVPIGGMLTQEWSLDQPPTAAAVAGAVLLYQNSQAEVYLQKIDLNQNGVLYPIAEENWVEAYAFDYFNLSPDTLRQERQTYYPQYHGYLAFSAGGGPPHCAIIRDASKSENQLLITYEWLLSENFPQRSADYQDYPDGQQYQLEIRFREDGTGYCAACRLVN